MNYIQKRERWHEELSHRRSMTSVTPFFFVGWIPVTVGDLDAAKTIDQQLLPNVGERERGEGQKDKNTMIAKQRQWLYLQSSVVEISWKYFLRNCCILLSDFVRSTPVRYNEIFTLSHIYAIFIFDHSIWTLEAWQRTGCPRLRVGAWRDNPFQKLVVEPECVTLFHIATSMQKLL